MPIFVLFVSAGVLFDGAFSLWVSLSNSAKYVEAQVTREKALIFLCSFLQWSYYICRIQFNMPWKFLVMGDVVGLYPSKHMRIIWMHYQPNWSDVDKNVLLKMAEFSKLILRLCSQYLVQSSKFPLVGETGGIPPHYPQNWLVPLPMSPIVLLPKCWFCNFHAVLLNLSSPTSWLYLGNPGQWK